MVGWLKALLFVTGGVAAATGTAYVTGLLDPFFAKRPEVVASLPQDGPQAGPEQAPASSEQRAPDVSSRETAADEKQDRLVVPTFDLLRVEPDGSLLVAGKAGSNATVEILNGDDVLVSATATADGDFVAILDEPLTAGDYRLALRSISGDIVAISKETATVSIPEEADGPVLAMVEAPGAPSELMTIPRPSADVPGERAEPAAEMLEAGPAGASAGQEEPLPQGQDPQVTEDGQLAEDGSTGAASPEFSDTPVQGETQEAAAVAGEQPSIASETDATAQTSPLPDMGLAAEAAEDGRQPAGTDVASAPAISAPETAGQAPGGGQQPGVVRDVTVEAVEIEGDTIFVAGRSAPGGTVRVYADDILLGDAVVSEGGRFLVEARRDLPVGQYVIRADLLDTAGAVLSRAAVPFEREQGEAVAAVAPAQTQMQTQAPEGEAVASGGEGGEPAAVPEATAAARNDVTAPALQRVDGSVIIRRGDSLWRISRRVYGRGVRYSTIYLANQDQISDPNRIWPGQVFSVPQETPQGEQADMEAVGERARAPEDRSSVQ